MMHEDADLLADCAVAVLGRHDPASWRHAVDDTWHYVRPLGHRSRNQGWKLHVPATPLSACVVLSRCVAVLASHRCAFKFARSMRELQMLIEPNADRTSAGKFLTAYPDDDEHAVRIADALHEATLGLPGQEILTDRRFRENSQVHYRYGAFSPDTTLSLDGQYVNLLYDDTGATVADPRSVGKPAPDWVTDPFQSEEPPSVGTPKSVLIGGQYRVHGAIRQTNRGGVYLATDTATGTEVVLKRFRRYVAAAVNGADSRNRARAEARLLTVLSPTGASPRFIDLLTHNNDMFVVQERITGSVLRQYVMRNQRPTRHGSLALQPRVVLDFAAQLVELLATVHDAGYVLGDLSPNNIMVTPDDRLVLIDLESALRSWEVSIRLTTRGYGAPEENARARLVSPAPLITADLYSLGATLFFLAAAAHPQPAPGTRLREMVAMMAARNPAVAVLAPLIIGLLADDPADRPTLAELRTALAGPRLVAPIAVPEQPGTDDVIEDMLATIRLTMTPDEPWLWRPTMVGSRYDPCSVHTGAAGQLIALNQAMRAGCGDQIESTADTAAQWLAKRLIDEPELLPGMTFGRSGTALTLVEAGTLLDDPRLAATGFDLARRLPTSWPVPDVFHGVAGAGIALLRLWRLTDDPEFLDRARRCAEGVLAEMRIDAGLVTWTATGDFILAGKAHWGFAHGVAGIGTFLVEAGTATGDQRYVDAARQCAATLATIADRDGWAAFWPSGEQDANADTRRMTGLCSGSSGVGTFLLRFFAATGESTAEDLARAAAFAVRCANWTAQPVWCHGLASDGDFLLDCAEVFGEQRYRDWAADTADIIAARTVLVDGRRLTPDETGATVVSYGNGFVGPLSFLLRLRHGGERPLFGSPAMVRQPAPPRSLGRLDMLEGGVPR